jgi:hypothetical protein
VRIVILIAFFVAVVLGVTEPVVRGNVFLPDINNGRATSNGTIPQPSSMPSPTVEPTTEPTTEPTSNQLAVLQNWSSYVDNAGHLEVVGELLNIGSLDIGSVEMTATLFNEQGKVLAIGSGLAAAKVIIPGEKSCFWIYFADPPPENEFTSINFYGTWVLISHYKSGLIIFNDSASYDPSFNYYRLTGQVRNDSAQTANNVIVAGTLYSDSAYQGKVIRCRSELLSSVNLDPGQVGIFDVDFGAPVPEAVGSYRLEAQADPSSH